ncbi:MAG: hypothetical protein A2672_03265 [Candidatus Wildermuthbacteria bacterium RIFCSPHIGHO2_01_FULL_49_22b]|uniref:Uncharacterized protein n=1 Tax=Candidatus Wildermuthbacteria bacterium RIFCSPHIGHO2_01_FULL_49_22b TaxID=1802448 RepID=A0A1G2QXF8_9BACT|nr:MAG: hypothetical protein A2672_03265 [Candidatus Wildermuthbacteria bacterium RIFCSPHIGHO2_01_FULL_49_22b]
MDLEKLKQLLGNPGGKVVVVENGEPVLVVSSYEEHKRSLEKPQLSPKEMLIVSNHLMAKGGFVLPDHAVVRVNVAWIPTKEKLVETLGEIKHDIYLDYPQGRTKPPKPTIALHETIAIIPQFPQIKHFAVSNVEDPEAIHAIKTQLPSHVGIVPKIETRRGIENLEAIVEKIQNRYIMFDKEDLYLDVDRDPVQFEALIDLARQKSKKLGIEILELHGVVFLPYQNS